MARLRTAARSANGPVSWGGAQASKSFSNSSSVIVWIRGRPTFGQPGSAKDTVERVYVQEKVIGGHGVLAR